MDKIINVANFNVVNFDVVNFDVVNLDVDHIDYNGSKDFQIYTEYLNDKECNIIIRRIDTLNNEGWNEELSIFIINKTTNNNIKINIGSSTDSSIKKIFFNNELFTPFIKSDKNTKLLENYEIKHNFNINNICRADFNKLFETDIVALPSSMFAVGIKNNIVYQYHDTYGGYPWTYEIELSINHIVSVIIEHKLFHEIYFLICAHDGYMEGYYPSIRDKPYIVKDDEFFGKVVVKVDDENTFPVLHKNLYVLGQSIHPDISYNIAIADRYYFCLNRYNLYHSIHRGILFKNKINKIVYACNPRGVFYNFTKRRDIKISQREYFKSDIVPKLNIYTAEYIDRNEMIQYKYVLDIDGNSSTWDATAWKLNSGSVIFKTDSNWHQWFYEDYKPWIHYIPINDDFSNILEMFVWCELNQEKCEIMINNCKELFHTVYKYQNVVNYTIKQLCKIKAFSYSL